MLIIQFANGNKIKEECSEALWNHWCHNHQARMRLVGYFIKNTEVLGLISRVLYEVQ